MTATADQTQRNKNSKDVLRVFLRPLANARRDREFGVAFVDHIQETLAHLDDMHRRLGGFNVLVLTEFHRDMGTEAYTDFCRHMAQKLGLTHALGFKKNVPLAEQVQGFDTKHPSSFETIVFTSLTPPEWKMERHVLSANVGGVSLVHVVSNRGFMFAHLSLSDGQPGPYRDAYLQEMKVIEENHQIMGVAGDLNLTDGMVRYLGGLPVSDGGGKEALQVWGPNLAQPDFVCMPHDMIPQQVLVPEEKLIHGQCRAIIADNGATKPEEKKLRIVSSLGQLTSGWDLSTARYFHPVTHEEITKHTAGQVAAIVLDAMRQPGGEKPMLWDHASCYVESPDMSKWVEKKVEK